MRLPRRLGGFGIPCLETMGRLLALRTIMSILDQMDSPGRALALYFLGPSRRLLAPHLTGNLFPSAEAMPPIYKSAIGLYRDLLSLDPTVDVRQTQPSRLCEQLVVHKAAHRVEPPDYPWRALTMGRLPEEAKDTQWERGWRILPTKDRLQRWGITNNAACPNCGRQETTDHAVASCGVAKAFWRLVHRAAPGLKIGQYYARGRCPRDAFARLCLVVGERVLWKNRCKAVGQDRRLRLQWPLLARLKRELRSFLTSELFWLGEEEFLRHWSCDFVTMAEGRVCIGIDFPDMCV